MCGSLYSLRGRISFLRLTLPDDVAQPLIDHLIEEYRRNPPDRRNLPWPPKNFYVKPTNQLPVIVGNSDAELEPRSLKWGHAPKLYKSKQPLFNARGETLGEKATWREPWHTGRCLIPVGGFFEWVNKQPHVVRERDQAGMYFAGLWREDDGIEWCSIVTCAPSDWFSQYHHREPVVIRGDDWMRWLFDEDPPEDLIQPSSPDQLEVFPCSKPQHNREPAPVGHEPDSAVSTQRKLF